MIVYTHDISKEKDVNKEIRDMSRVLAEIVPTFRTLEGLLNDHKDAINTPNLERFREDLQSMLPEAMRLAHLISTNSQLLASASSQASKQLVAVEDNVKNSLMGAPEVTDTMIAAPKAEGYTNPGKSIEGNTSPRLFQRRNVSQARAV